MAKPHQSKTRTITFKYCSILSTGNKMVGIQEILLISSEKQKCDMLEFLRYWSRIFILLSLSVLGDRMQFLGSKCFQLPQLPGTASHCEQHPGCVSWIFRTHLNFNMFKMTPFLPATPVISSVLFLLPLVFMVTVNCAIRYSLFKPEYYNHP